MGIFLIKVLVVGQTEKKLLLSVWPAETGKANRDGHKIPELLQTKRKLDLSILFECKPPQYLHTKHSERSFIPAIKILSNNHKIVSEAFVHQTDL